MKPQADHYVGRSVVNANMPTDSEEIDWGVMLDGNVQIFNDDPEREQPEDLSKAVGTQLLRVILSEDETRLQFGYTKQDAPAEIVTEISFSPLAYMISDGAYADGPHAPQVAEELEIPAEPVERIAEGKEEAIEENQG